ncbi:MAG: hypothetical protein Q8L71_11860 [Thiobacillus sp.]|nr:hypothetical protein [Thiobacillus sp.]
MIREVLRRLAGNPAIPSIAINLSGRSLSEPGRLIVEITETAAVSDLQMRSA